MIKKSLKSKTSKSHIWAPLKVPQHPIGDLFGRNTVFVFVRFAYADKIFSWRSKILFKEVLQNRTTPVRIRILLSLWWGSGSDFSIWPGSGSSSYWCGSAETLRPKDPPWLRCGSGSALTLIQTPGFHSVCGSWTGFPKWCGYRSATTILVKELFWSIQLENFHGLFLGLTVIV
jgi:hypothetical protein